MEDCARMNCDKPAVAVLTFAPQQAKAWLYDLEETDKTGSILLCRKHANATVVPMSWQLVDSRDPAWPGPANQISQVDDASLVDVRDVPARHGIVGERHPLAAALPSDSSYDREFAALDGALPVTPQRYHEPRAATLRAAGVLTESEPTGDADLSLFQLPLTDVPAVTPHPDYG